MVVVMVMEGRGWGVSGVIVKRFQKASVSYSLHSSERLLSLKCVY